MSMYYPLAALVIILLSFAAAAYSIKQQRADKVKIAARKRQEQFDRDEYVQSLANYINMYHDVISGYGGKARQQMKREVMRNLGKELPKGAVKAMVPYLEDGMTGDDFVIDVNNRPEVLQPFLDGR